MRGPVFALGLVVAGSAWAQPIEVLRFAEVIASNQACHFDVDEKKIENWVRANAPGFDLEWLKNLDVAVEKANAALPDLTPEQMVVHCTRVSDIAKALGFIE